MNIEYIAILLGFYCFRQKNLKLGKAGIHLQTQNTNIGNHFSLTDGKTTNRQQGIAKSGADGLL
jgi:hypothetical protein